MSAQLPLALRHSPDQRLDSYIGIPDGLADSLARLAAGGGEWVYLAGVQGSGKTHLALAACELARRAGCSVAYLPLAAAAGQGRDALDALDGHDLVVLDGLDTIAGRRADEIAVFDFHNRARAAGSGVLYTAGAMPDALGLSLPDLRSRLSQCIRFALPVLDDDGRRALLRDRARRRGLVLEEAAIDWLLAHAERDVPGLVVLLDRLDRASLAEQRRITVPFLKQVLAAQ